METLWPEIAYYISLRYLLIAGGAYLLCYVLFRNQFFQHKIQLIFPKNKQVVLEVLYSMQTTLIFASIFFLVVIVLRSYTNLYSEIADGPLRLRAACCRCILECYIHGLTCRRKIRQFHIPRRNGC